MTRKRNAKGAIVGLIYLVCLLPLLFPLRLAASELPEVTSVFPLSGQQGSTYTAEIRGQNLDKAYAIWFDCDDLKAEIKGIERVEAEAKDPYKDLKGEKQRALVEVVIRPGARVGAHILRVVTPDGVSGPLAMRVSSEPVTLETRTPHDTPAKAQTLNFPAVVDGRISGPGELDCYEIKVEKGQELLFEVLTSGGLFSGGSGVFQSPHIALYEPSGSWFDPNQLVQLVPHDESLFTGSGQYLPRLTYRFGKAMSLLVEVSAFEQPGGPDYCYQLRIAPAQLSRGLDEWTPRLLAHEIPNEFQERDFTRGLKAGWIEKISSRTVEPKNSYRVSRVEEQEPNNTPAQAAEFTSPALIEGAVGRPGDTDYFKFQVKEKQTLVFEIETPRMTLPYFNPLLAVLDEQGQELVRNLYRRVGGSGGDWTKTLEPKTVYTFERAGTYYLRMCDIANHAGTPDFRYRILVRPGIPHMGNIAPKEFSRVGSESEEDRVNLVAGEAKKWEVVSEREEGFEGEFAISIENLPPGVQAFAAAAPRRELPSQSGQAYEVRGAIHKEYYRPRRLETTLLLVASPDAPATRLPRMIRLVATPVVNGKPGAPQTVEEYPLMVLRPAETDAPKQLKERADAATLKQK
jgi:hypothetical protein